MLLVVLIIIQTLWAMPSNADPHRILILPLKIYSEKDMSFLQQGIQATLTSRLTRQDQVQPIAIEAVRTQLGDPDGAMNASIAKKLGRQMNARYVVFGSITIFGGRISTDLHCLDAVQSRSVLVLNESGEAQGDIIQHVHLFTDKLSAALLNDADLAEVTQTSPEKTPSAKHATLSTGSMAPKTDPPSTIIATPHQPRSILKRFAHQIQGLAVGDVNGDRSNEIVCIGLRSISIYGLSKGQLKRIWESQDDSVQPYLSVDVADINRNGRAEIFITTTPAADEPLRSFVLEFDGSQFSTIAEKQKWYYRVMASPDKSPLLVGQRRGRMNDPIQKSMPFYGPVYELKWIDGAYQKTAAVHSPKKSANLYQMALADRDNDTDHGTVIYTNNNRLRLINADGELQWQSDEVYGATTTYLVAANPNEPHDTQRVFIPARIVFSDVDGDGHRDLIAVKNHQSMGGIFRNTRLFDGGEIECLKWNGMEMAPAWQTRKALKYISDFAIADIDNDGRRELVYAVVKKKTGADKGKSHLVTEELP